MADFGLLWDGRVIDLRPMRFGGTPVVFNPASGGWVPFEGTLGQVADSKPLTADKAASLIPGAILSPEEVRRFAERSVARRKEAQRAERTQKPPPGEGAC